MDLSLLFKIKPLQIPATIPSALPQIHRLFPSLIVPSFLSPFDQQTVSSSPVPFFKCISSSHLAPSSSASLLRYLLYKTGSCKVVSWKTPLSPPVRLLLSLPEKVKACVALISLSGFDGSRRLRNAYRIGQGFRMKNQNEGHDGFRFRRTQNTEMDWSMKLIRHDKRVSLFLQGQASDYNQKESDSRTCFVTLQILITTSSQWCNCIAS